MLERVPFDEWAAVPPLESTSFYVCTDANLDEGRFDRPLAYLKELLEQPDSRATPPGVAGAEGPPYACGIVLPPQKIVTHHSTQMEFCCFLSSLMLAHLHAILDEDILGRAHDRRTGADECTACARARRSIAFAEAVVAELIAYITKHDIQPLFPWTRTAFMYMCSKILVAYRYMITYVHMIHSEYTKTFHPFSKTFRDLEMLLRADETTDVPQATMLLKERVMAMCRLESNTLLCLTYPRENDFHNASECAHAAIQARSHPKRQSAVFFSSVARYDFHI